MAPSDRDNPLALHNDFNMLSLPDLLLAREKNHVELMRRENVIGTAVGLYLIRKEDPWPSRDKRPARKHQAAPRTLGNSEVRDYSWPCILVFVDKWKQETELRWQDVVPEALYLDDKRKVPVCVVLAPKEQTVDAVVRNAVFPSWRIGGGFPVIAEVQGREHVASIGCLVTDGHTVYALTNRHVTGEEGEPVYSRFGGQNVRIGVSSSKQLRRLPFRTVYADWAGKEVYLNLDIGLIRVDDLQRWTADVYGIGKIGPIADLGVDNLSLRLIDWPVRGYGCGSGMMEGAIKALFYRYKSLGGFEYVSDFLIGPREDGRPFGTHPGDSGTLWLLEYPELGLMPIAVQWGGQVFNNGETRASYALASCLSTVCNLLEVDVVRDWNIGVSEYWGEVGHYTIGALACTIDFDRQPNLARLMSANMDRVGFKEADLRKTEKVLRSKAHFSFVPLADVADEIWRNTRTGDREKNNDSNNHFADLDEPAVAGRFKGKTLLKLCEDPRNIDPAVWDEFYRGVPDTRPGALPFRVWQGYDEMVAALRANDILRFVCVAGCMAHYVGDACEPLHVSRLHHGDPKDATSVSKKVHSVYETQMLNDHAAEVVDGVVKFLRRKKVKPAFQTGYGAAQRVFRLMRETLDALPPRDIVDVYNAAHGPADRVRQLWDRFGEATIERMGHGCLCMAEIWASAWAEAGAERRVRAADLVALDEEALAALYKRPEFYPSMSLRLMIPLLTPAKKTAKRAAAGVQAARRRPAKRATIGRD